MLNEYKESRRQSNVGQRPKIFKSNPYISERFSYIAVSHGEKFVFSQIDQEKHFFSMPCHQQISLP